MKNPVIKALLITFATCFMSLGLFSQTSYYISSTGNNSNSGKSPGTPWRSLQKIEIGNTYLFHCNDTFYQKLSCNQSAGPDMGSQTNKDQKITISSYGNGNKPVISLYKNIINKNWVNAGNNIWKVSLKNAENYTGFKEVNTNVGFIKVDGIIFGNKTFSPDSLKSQWDFYCDDEYLFVYSNDDLSSSAKNIQAACNFVAIYLCNNMDVSNLTITGSGGHGIRGVNVKNINLEKLDISEIGGSFLQGYGNGRIRYGNGVEFWNGSENCLIKGCKVSMVYDVAFTMQGNGPGTHFLNVVFDDNISNNNEQSFEFWIKGNQPGFTACKFINNYCSNAGYGWSHDVRPVKNFAVFILNSELEANDDDILIENNTFIKAKSAYFYMNSDLFEKKSQFITKNNKIEMEPGVPLIRRGRKIVINTLTDSLQENGFESGSHFSTPQ